jgi:hypothetical protein
MEAVMTEKPFSVEIYTTGYRILGRLSRIGRGLYSFINDPTQSYIEIEGAHLNRLHQPERLVARYPKIWLMKRDLVALLLSARAEVGPTAGARRGYASTALSPVHISLGGYELIGNIETTGGFRFSAVMFEGKNLFSPLYDAELVATLYPDVRAEAPAVLFNLEMVEYMALLPRESQV